MAEALYNKEYNSCSADEKKECNKKGREAMLATVYIMKADKGRYSKLLTDLHDDHLKGYAPYPHNLADAQKLLLNYSSSNNKQKTKDKRDDNNDVSDLAFAQDGRGGGYTFRQGPTQTCFFFNMRVSFERAAEVRDSPKFFKILRILLKYYHIMMTMGMY
jgi:hypothetical protein